MMQGITGMGGPPFVTILLSKNDNDNVTRVNVLIMATGIVISAVISMYGFNVFTKELFLTEMIASLFYIFASFCGSRFNNLSGNIYYRNISLLILVLIRITTLVSAFFKN